MPVSAKLPLNPLSPLERDALLSPLGREIAVLRVVEPDPLCRKPATLKALPDRFDGSLYSERRLRCDALRESIGTSVKPIPWHHLAHQSDLVSASSGHPFI